MIPHFTDHAANERTYLAWVRTAISVMAFGFLLERFDIFLTYATRSAERAVFGLHTRASEWLGLGLLFVGALIILGATQRFYRNRRTIEAAESSPYGDYWIARVMSALLIVMALFLMLYVAKQIAALG
ncbi:YidH family protein [Dyella humicola]|uniref:YidH family protein n=1 Tax=Dyella humicola TaxID=2992126 RepID=UPI00224FEB94